MTKVDVKALGLTLGIVWSLTVFIMGIISIFFEWGSTFNNLISSLYIGYAPTLLGSIIGAIWGFFDAGIGGLIIGWLYNKLAK